MGDGLDLPAFVYEHRECSILEIVDEHTWFDMRALRYERSKDET